MLSKQASKQASRQVCALYNSRTEGDKDFGFFDIDWH